VYAAAQARTKIEEADNDIQNLIWEYEIYQSIPKQKEKL
jgi:hypothetical protein